MRVCAYIPWWGVYLGFTRSSCVDQAHAVSSFSNKTSALTTLKWAVECVYGGVYIQRATGCMHIIGVSALNM